MLLLFVILKIQYTINRLDRYPLRENINKERKKERKEKAMIIIF